jgi:light-regulated signal transduction histidine kinase (bacteriophytochrome)
VISEPSRNLQFTVEPGITVAGDHQLMAICMENLLGNAAKYSSRKDPAIIEFGRMPVAGEEVLFVRDNGAGFDMAYLGKLFKPFGRLHSESEFPGTGIGLATVQRIVERHGGRVWAEGREGEGATIFFTLNVSGKD